MAYLAWRQSLKTPQKVIRFMLGVHLCFPLFLMGAVADSDGGFVSQATLTIRLTITEDITTKTTATKITSTDVSTFAPLSSLAMLSLETGLVDKGLLFRELNRLCSQHDQSISSAVYLQEVLQGSGQGTWVFDPTRADCGKRSRLVGPGRVRPLGLSETAVVRIVPK